MTDLPSRPLSLREETLSMPLIDMLKIAMADLDEDVAIQLVKDAIERGEDALVLLRACQDGMTEVGRRFEREDYCVSELMMSGEIFTSVAEILAPALKACGGGTSAGTVIMGTVKGDIHNLGKDIVINMLKAANFAVIDLGVDVSPQTFVAKLRSSGARVVGMSGLLTLTFDSMKETVESIRTAGLRDRVKIMIGGRPVNASVCRYVGADDWSTDAQKAVRLAREWIAPKE
jgi:methanogenic corrinoid protein MtbC1